MMKDHLSFCAGERQDARNIQQNILPCPVEEAARIVGQKWTLQIVHALMDHDVRRFCELQDALGGVNPSTLSARLKMLEEEGLVQRIQVSATSPHIAYCLTPMGDQLSGVIRELTNWSRVWLCGDQRPLYRRPEHDLIHAN